MKDRNNIKFESIEEQDLYLQGISLKELKDIGEDVEFISITQLDIEQEESVAELDEQVMESTLKDLRILVDKSEFAKQELSIEEKVKLTGLSEEDILRVETEKHKATLEQIIDYCSGLQIKFEEFLPELFEKKVA